MTTVLFIRENLSLVIVFNSMSTQNLKTRRIFTKGLYSYTSRTTRVEGVSRIEVYSQSLIIQNYITPIILPVSSWRPVPTSTCRHTNVTRVLVNNHASAWELVVYERGDGTEIKTHRRVARTLHCPYSRWRCSNSSCTLG